VSPQRRPQRPSASSAVSFRNVSKRFPGARALEDVSFDVRRGSCHALCGENGAGKSTLGKLLAGIEQPDAGEIAVDGRVVTSRSRATPCARASGWFTRSWRSARTCRSPRTCAWAICRRADCSSRAARWRGAAPTMMAAIDAPIDVRRLVGDLTVAEQQMVQIAARGRRAARA
jgi:ABC-type sugar transport system ATPase subunit